MKSNLETNSLEWVSSQHDKKRKQWIKCPTDKGLWEGIGNFSRAAFFIPFWPQECALPTWLLLSPLVSVQCLTHIQKRTQTPQRSTLGGRTSIRKHFPGPAFADRRAHAFHNYLSPIQNVLHLFNTAATTWPIEQKATVWFTWKCMCRVTKFDERGVWNSWSQICASSSW